MSKSILIAHRDTWKRKPTLKFLYTDWYQQITSQLIAGNTLELGGGSGNLKEFSPDVICTDIVKVPWLDAVADAQSLPFGHKSLSNIVLFDVLHHIENPALFLNEAIRVLTVGGRIIIVEPYVSLLSWPIYKFIHPEPVDFQQDPFAITPSSKTRKPFDANQAMSKLIFEYHYKEFTNRFKPLTLIKKRYISYFVYPLSGGFDQKSFIPRWFVAPMMRLEQKLEFMGKFIAFRIFIVLEKTIENKL